MALANDMTELVNKIERRLGLTMLTPHLPESLNKEAWANLIKTDTMVTFSRYFPNKVRFVVNKDSCDIRKENGRTWYYIKEEYLGGAKLLGVYDIDWTDTSGDNLSISQNMGYGYYVPNYGSLESTYTSFIQYQSAADVASLYNNNIFLDFEYPNKFCVTRAGNIDFALHSFVITLLVQHSTLVTISPTKMETFEALAQADIARMLYMNLRYLDNLETIYLNLDLKLAELDQEGDKREQIIEELKQSWVSAANDNIPYIMTVSGGTN